MKSNTLSSRRLVTAHTREARLAGTHHLHSPLGRLPKTRGACPEPLVAQETQRVAPPSLGWGKGLKKDHGFLCQTQEGEWGQLQEVGGGKLPPESIPPPPPPLLTCPDLAHAQCAHELGWLGEGTGWHPHLKGQCQPCCSQEGQQN